MTGSVLVLNSGSSSMKYQWLDPEHGKAIAVGIIERIGSEDASATHKQSKTEFSFAGPIADHGAALLVMQKLFGEAGTKLTDAGLVAIGHRVVHGGAVFSAPVIVDETILAQIDELSVLAPLHNPANVEGIRSCLRIFPDLPQVAVFDTAFFRTLPPAAFTYAIDRTLADRYQVRRYGFHGTSHQYVAGQVAKALGRSLSELNQIILHLGNGASASAVAGGIAVDTSMGLTPLQGLVMGTRSGDIDPGVLTHLHRVAGLSFDDLDNLLNRRSGVLGLSGVSDFRDLHTLIAKGDANAAVALEVYCHRVRSYVGAYIAVLGGADVITFTAGVGENDAVVRAKILGGLGKLGIEIDDGANKTRSGAARVISTANSTVTVMVVPTNEELAIAQATLALVG